MSSLNSYFQMQDLDKTLRDAVEAGATVDHDQIPIGVMQLRG